MVKDTLGRPVRDLRISVTDRCNFRCTYCMPKEIFGKDYEFLARDQLLSFDEITRIATAFAQLGVTKLRLTGGEPLLRRGIEELIGSLAQIRGIDDLTLTTNGSLLERKSEALAAAGLDRVTVSLDSMDDTVFMSMNDVGYPVESVLSGIDAAAAAGLTPVKINMVVKRGVNEDSITEVAEHFRDTGHIVRFIEYMDVGTTNGWKMDQVVPSAEVVERISEKFPLVAADANYQGEVAQRWEYEDGAGEIGVISSVTQPFCGDCSRVRLSAEGRLYTCLFAASGSDLRAAIRNGADDVELKHIINDLWSNRSDRYSEVRSAASKRRRIEMSYIGG